MEAQFALLSPECPFPVRKVVRGAWILFCVVPVGLSQLVYFVVDLSPSVQRVAWKFLGLVSFCMTVVEVHDVIVYNVTILLGAELSQ